MSQVKQEGLNLLALEAQKMEMEDTEYRSREIVNRIDTSTIQIVQETEEYNIEKVMIQGEKQKYLSRFRLKKSKNESLETWMKRKEETKDNFNSIKREFNCYNFMPIIFSIEEQDENLIIYTQPILDSFNYSFRFTSYEYLKWLLDITQDLNTLSSKNISLFNHNGAISPIVPVSYGNAKLNPLLLLSSGEKKASKPKEVIIIGMIACLSNILKKDLTSTIQKKRGWERTIIDIIAEVEQAERQREIQLAIKKNLENQSKKGKVSKKKGDRIKIFENNEKSIAERVTERFRSRNAFLFECMLEIVSSEDENENPLPIIQIYCSKAEQTLKNQEINLKDEKNTKRLKQKLDNLTSDESVNNFFEPVKFSFSIYADTREVVALYNILSPHSNQFITLSILFQGVNMTNEMLLKQVIPLLAFPNLKEMRLGLCKSFEHQPIFWTELTEVVEEEQNIIEEKQISKKQKRKIEEKRLESLKEKNDQTMKQLIDQLVSIASNEELEVLEVNLEKNYAVDEDIQILLTFIERSFPNIKTLELSWCNALLTKQQFSSICKYLELFKSKLQRIDLTLWRNSQIGDEEVRQLTQVLRQFTNLNSLVLGLLECDITDQSGEILGQLLADLPFLQCFEIGLDDDRLRAALAHLGNGLKNQKLIRYLGMSHQDSILEDKILEEFSYSLIEMYDLNELHFFIGKNDLSSQGICQLLKQLTRTSGQIEVLDLGFSQNRLLETDYVQHFMQLLQNQHKLKKLELCMDDTKSKGASISQIIKALNWNLKFELIHLNLENCRLNTIGFQSITELFKNLQHPQLLTHLRLYLHRNFIGSNETEQADLAIALQRYINLTELELDFSGCSLHDQFYSELSLAIQSMTKLISYSLLLHRCPLTMSRLKLILLSLMNKSLLEELTIEIQESEQLQIDSLILDNGTTLEENMTMPNLKQLTVNLLNCNWSFAIVVLLLSKISAQGCVSNAMPYFSSLSVYVRNQRISEQHLSDFATILKQAKNLSELTLTLDACGLDEEKTAALFSAPLNQLRNLDLSLNENISINMKSLSQFIKKQKSLVYLGISLKVINEPIEYFGTLGDALANLDLHMFNFFFEQSQVSLPKYLESFYLGLSRLKNLEVLTFHLHNLDHSQMQIVPFTVGLRSMTKLQALNIHLPNSNLRSLEVKELALSLCGKKFLKELHVELYKNEIADKSGIYFGKAFTSLNSLEKLDFSLMRCEILPCTSENICLGIGMLNNLKKLHLYLGENSVSPFTLTSLTYSFQDLERLIQLKLSFSDTGVGDEGVQQLALGLIYLKQLLILDLILENTDIQQDSLIAISTYFQQTGKHSLQQLGMCLRNNTAITEQGFQSLVNGIGQLGKLTHLLLLFNHCMLDAATSSHLHLCLQQKPLLKYLNLYFDENGCDAMAGKLLGQAFKNNCPKIKRLILCLQQNRLGNEGVSDLFEGMFSVPELQKTTVDVRQNEINSAETVQNIANSIQKSKRIRSVELLIFEDFEVSDRNIARGLFSLAKIKIEMCQQLNSLEIRNRDWKETFKETLIPISSTTIAFMQIITFKNYISKFLHFHESYIIWDLYVE